jgi:hypothetical protein
MNQTLILILLILLILLVAIIMLYLAGYFNKKPSDIRPFSDFLQLIDPTLLPEAKKDYNEFVLAFFRVLNNQSEKISMKSLKTYIPPLINQMQPIIKDLQQKYSPAIGGKLLQYFACKHLVILLDNYYNGPPINFMIPSYPLLYIESFPFIYVPKKNRRVINASSLAPFKYFIHNIPSKIRDEVIVLYDNIVYRYMMAINETVASLSEVNVNTIKEINLLEIMVKYGPMIQKDLIEFQKLFGENMVIIIKNLFMKNSVPLLDNFYRGPVINFKSPTITNLYNTSPQVITINYPNKNKDKIFISTPVLQNSILSSVTSFITNSDKSSSA